MKLDPVKSVLEAMQAGELVVVLDDKGRENEADIVIAAELVTANALSFMIREGRTMVCLAMTEQRLESLGIPLQNPESPTAFSPRFGVGFDHCSVAGEGISAASRVVSIREAVRDPVQSDDFVTPGYVFPLASRPGGVLSRRGHTEASVDLARLAGCQPAAVICELMDESGEMLVDHAVEEFCKKHKLKLTSVDAIAQYRLKNEVSLRPVAELIFNKEMLLERSPEVREAFAGFSGRVAVTVFHDDVDDKQHFAIVVGTPKDGALVRIHSECLTGDVFGSARCDCGDQLDDALLHIFDEGSGVIVYLHQEGRGIGLGNKMKAYALQDQGFDTVEANVHLGFEPDERDYRAGANILSNLGINQVRLLTNNPEKLHSLSQFGIREIERVPLAVRSNPYNEKYLATKRDRMGHLLPEGEDQ